MNKEEMIAADEFCMHHNVALSFISLLSENGLIEITEVDDHRYIPTDKLQQLEKLVRLHYDMEINVEGIEAISYLLQRIEAMQSEITSLKNRLHMYE